MLHTHIQIETSRSGKFEITAQIFCVQKIIQRFEEFDILFLLSAVFLILEVSEKILSTFT